MTNTLSLVVCAAFINGMWVEMAYQNEFLLLPGKATYSCYGLIEKIFS